MSRQKHMADDASGGRALKRKVLGLLQADEFDESFEEFLRLPGRQVINPLFSFLLSTDETVRWRAVTAMGAVIEHLANTNMESARIIMRRLMWSLNDESGGIGWGAPEVMAEAMARHEGLAHEYSAMIASYCNEEGNFLEHEPLQRGLLWGLIRLAGVRPKLVEDVIPHLEKYLESGDPVVRGLAGWAVGMLGDKTSRPRLLALLGDRTELRLFWDGNLVDTTVMDLAKRGLNCLDE